MRQRTRKEWAAEIRNLLKRLGISHISVTAPNYSMAQSVNIRTPQFIPWEGEHKELHDKIGYSNACDICKRENAAKRKLEEIILAAFPDLEDRSNSQIDHFDYCLSIN